MICRTFSSLRKLCLKDFLLRFLNDKLFFYAGLWNWEYFFIFKESAEEKKRYDIFDENNKENTKPSIGVSVGFKIESKFCCKILESLAIEVFVVINSKILHQRLSFELGMRAPQLFFQS